MHVWLWKHNLPSATVRHSREPRPANSDPIVTEPSGPKHKATCTNTDTLMMAQQPRDWTVGQTNALRTGLGAYLQERILHNARIGPSHAQEFVVVKVHHRSGVSTPLTKRVKAFSSRERESLCGRLCSRGRIQRQWQALAYVVYEASRNTGFPSRLQTIGPARPQQLWVLSSLCRASVAIVPACNPAHHLQYIV